MYQSVDDPEDLEQEIAAERAKARRTLWTWIVVAIAALALIAALSGSRSNESPDACLLYTSPSPRDGLLSRMPSSA